MNPRKPKDRGSRESSLFRTRVLPLCVVILAATAAWPLHAQTWYRGNTHAHSLWSDGNDFPEMIMDWYKSHDYDFAVLSDHNILATGQKWMGLQAVARRQRALGKPAFDKYLRRFGEDWVETREVDGKTEVRLKKLAEYRGKFEKAGEFLIVQAEEISNYSAGKPVHVNAVNLPGTKPIPAIKSKQTVREILRENLRAIAELEAQTGEPILAHLNHPNFGWAITAEDLAHVVEEQFFEVFNGHPGIRHLGDKEHPGDEQIWDIANTIRLTKLNAPPLYGVATDDSHHYHGGNVSPGRGWVMVRARELSGAALVEAMREGRFYASSGVFLDAVEYEPDTRTLRLRIRPNGEETFTTQLIGTRRIGDRLGPIGEVLAEKSGTGVEFQIPDDALYARAMIQSSRSHPNPSFEGQKEQVWTQPVGWEK